MKKVKPALETPNMTVLLLLHLDLIQALWQGMY